MIKCGKIIIFALTYVLCCFQTGSVLANDKIDNYESYSDIPKALHKTYLNANTNKEQYIKRNVTMFDQLSKNMKYIDSNFIYARKEELVREARKRQRSSILNYDDNLDGVVSIVEIKQWMISNGTDASSKRFQINLDSTIKKLQKYDLNNDQLISNDEMIVLDERTELRIKEQVSNKYIHYLDIDPNKDGRLTTVEYSILITKVFNTLDINEDMILSSDEISKFRKDLRSQQARARNMMGRDNNLKNTNLDENSKISRVVADFKRIDAALATFRDMYDAYPGDMPNAYKRLPNCNVDNCGSGDGNGIVGKGTLEKIDLFKDERHLFWVHLNKSNLLSGYDTSKKIKKINEAYPTSALGGVFQVYLHNGTKPLPYSFKGSKARKGLYALLTNDASGDIKSKNSHFLTANQAALIDRKLDDGLPLTGAVIAAGSDKCIKKAESSLVYANANANDKKPCLSLYVRMQ